MRRATCISGAFAISFLATTGWAEEDPLPDFDTCLSGEILRYEQAVEAFAPTEAEKAGYPLANVSGVEFCGTIGIVICDRSDNQLGCQKALAVEQDIWRARVLTELPGPEEETAAEGENDFDARLYTQLFHLAHGMSAGMDCAGATPRMEMWCRAREANNRLRAAVLAWQVARHQGRVAPAFEAGWIAAPEPVRPRARPGGGE